MLCEALKAVLRYIAAQLQSSSDHLSCVHVLTTLFDETLGVVGSVVKRKKRREVADGGGEAAEAEKDSFDVVLTSAGEKKIQVIKVVREITSLGLKEAKALVDEAPKPVKEGASKDEAEEIQNRLQEAGATVELQ